MVEIKRKVEYRHPHYGQATQRIQKSLPLRRIHRADVGQYLLRGGSSGTRLQHQLAIHRGAHTIRFGRFSIRGDERGATMLAVSQHTHQHIRSPPGRR